MKKYFDVCCEKYVRDKTFSVYRPASLNHPKDNAVMFIMEKHISQANVFADIKECLIFWPEICEVSSELEKNHAVVRCESPHKEFARFYTNNHIVYLPQPETMDMVNGAYIARSARIGRDCRIFPGAYIGGEVEMGDRVYIGSGVKLTGEVKIGNNVVIRENTVIGADGLSTDRDESGKALTMPQFGGVVIEDGVQIGANTVIARGAIDNTILKCGCKIDNSTFISHNVQIGEDSFIVGETILFGSSRIGDRALVSGNSALSNYVVVGDDTTIGQSSLVTKSIPSGKIAFGSPAKVIRDK